MTEEDKYALREFLQGWEEQCNQWGLGRHLTNWHRGTGLVPPDDL
jgi:hypothetical protein